MIIAAYFILKGRDTHINFLRLLFMVGMICPLMQEHFFDLFCKVKLCKARLNKGFGLFNFSGDSLLDSIYPDNLNAR